MTDQAVADRIRIDSKQTWEGIAHAGTRDERRRGVVAQSQPHLQAMALGHLATGSTKDSSISDDEITLRHTDR